MGVDADAGAGMQFDKVELPGPAAAPACVRCQRSLDEYFEVGGHMFCRTCVDGFRTGSSFWRALLFGGGAALLGSLVWFAILKLFNYELGILGIAVGIFVGVAVRKGARGLGGWKLQALAMTLTYLSITASYVPIVITEMVTAAETKSAAGKAPADSEADEGAKAEADEAATDRGEPAAAVPAAPAEQAKPAKEAPPSGGMMVFAFLVVFGLALAMPFLAGADNFIGWIIIGVALYEAWKINRRVPTQGPLRFSGALSVPAPAPVTPGMPPPAAAP